MFRFPISSIFYSTTAEAANRVHAHHRAVRTGSPLPYPGGGVGRLWDPTAQVARASLPSIGALLTEASAGQEGGEAYERSLNERIPKTLY